MPLFTHEVKNQGNWKDNCNLGHSLIISASH